MLLLRRLLVVIMTLSHFITYCIRRKVFCAHAGSLMKVRDLSSQLLIRSDLADKPDHLVLRGGSSIIGPDGNYVVHPVFDKELILFAYINLKMTETERMTLDVSGHYARPDLFDLRGRSSRLEPSQSFT